MFQKIKNNRLLIIFFVLAGIVAVVWVYDRNNGERTFKRDLISVDTSMVTEITIYPKKSPDNPVQLIKTGAHWEVRNQNENYPADTNVIKNLLSTIRQLEAVRVAASDRSGWSEFEVTDSSSTRVVVNQGAAQTTEFRLGKISFTQNEQPQAYGRNRNPDIKTHIRMAGDDRVYVVDGFLTMLFVDQPAQYRNKTLIRVDKNLLTRLTFRYPGDSSFILTKTSDNAWLLNNQPADSAAVERYLSSIASATNSEFATKDTPMPVSLYQLKLEGNSMTEIIVEGGVDDFTKTYFLTSTANPSAIFSSQNPGLFNRIFVGQKRLFAN